MKKFNLLFLLFFLNNSIYSQNLILNGGFENWALTTVPDQWTLLMSSVNKNTTQFIEGTSSLQLNFINFSPNPKIEQNNINLVIGRTYRFKAKCKSNGGSIRFTTPVGQVTILGNNTWRTYESDFIFVASSLNRVIIEYQNDTNSQGFVDDVQIIDLTTLSTTENNLNSKIKFYPNPVKDILHIITETDEKIKGELYSINGQLLKTFFSEKVDLSLYQNGLYFMKIKTNEEEFIKKIIKE